MCDESLQLTDYDIEVLFEQAEEAQRLALKERDEAEAFDIRQSAFKRSCQVLSGETVCEGYFGATMAASGVDRERILNARSKVLEAQSTLASLQRERTMRTKARTVRQREGVSLWSLLPSQGYVAAVLITGVAGVVSSRPTVGAVLVGSALLLPAISAAADHWSCAGSVEERWARYHCPLFTENEERKQVCSKMASTAKAVCELHGHKTAACEAANKPHQSVCEDADSWTFNTGEMLGATDSFDTVSTYTKMAGSGWCSAGIGSNGHYREWKATMFYSPDHGTTCKAKCNTEPTCVGFWQYVSPSPSQGSCGMFSSTGSFSGGGYGLTYDRNGMGPASSGSVFILAPVANCECWQRSISAADGQGAADLSTNQPVEASSAGGSAAKAVDGDKGRSHPNEWHSGQSPAGQYEWIRVHLKARTTNPTIEFYARDCCTTDYGQEVHIMIGETSNKEEAADCGSITSITASSTRTTTCTGSGQYVWIRGNPSAKHWLEIPEFTVLGQPGIEDSQVSTTTPVLQSTIELQIEQLKNLTATQWKQYFFPGDLRNAYYGGFPSGNEGKCYTEEVSGNMCVDDAKYGNAAYNAACSSEASMAWSSVNRSKFVHFAMGGECSNPSSCTTVVCKKTDSAPVWRESVPAGGCRTNLTSILGTSFSNAEVFFSVECGIRTKMMICPKKLGVIQKCAVKKTCDAWQSPTLSRIWNDQGTVKVTLQNGISAEQWAQITQMAQFRTTIEGVCAIYCGFI
jgi:hypothetical protein